VRAREIRAECQVRKRVCVIVEHGADFVHVGDAVVILGSEGEAFEGGKVRDANCVKVPTAGNKREHADEIVKRSRGTSDQALQGLGGFSEVPESYQLGAQGILSTRTLQEP
jgi:hypothetical protein